MTMARRGRMTPKIRSRILMGMALAGVAVSAGCSETDTRQSGEGVDGPASVSATTPAAGSSMSEMNTPSTPIPTDPVPPNASNAPTEANAPSASMPTSAPEPATAPTEMGLGGADGRDGGNADLAGGSGGRGTAAGGSGGEPRGSGGDGGAGGSQSDNGENPGEPAVRFVGRFVEADDGGMSFEWSGSGIIAAFEGTAVSVTLEDSGNNEFSVVVDGELMPKLVAQGGSGDYELASGLAEGPHVVELYRRTEASFGTSTFHDFDFGVGQLLAPPPASAHRIEVIGDSITCGYGNEGESASCGFSKDTENHYATYGAIAARALAAELVTIAWSGKGIVYNYDTDTTDPLPALYDRVLPTRGANSWDFSWLPEAVVINLGTNDFSTDGDPTLELFRDEYAAFLGHLRDVYPDAYILCTVGPLLEGADLDAARMGIEAAVAVRKSAGDARVESWQMNIANDNPGCDYHPGLATHEAMGAALVAELRTRLGW